MSSGILRSGILRSSDQITLALFGCPLRRFLNLSGKLMEQVPLPDQIRRLPQRICIKHRGILQTLRHGMQSTAHTRRFPLLQTLDFKGQSRRQETRATAHSLHMHRLQLHTALRVSK